MTGSTERLRVQLTLVLDMIFTQWQLVGWMCGGWHAKFRKWTTNEHEMSLTNSTKAHKAYQFSAVSVSRGLLHASGAPTGFITELRAPVTTRVRGQQSAIDW